MNIGYGAITAAGRPTRSTRPISQLINVDAMIAPAQSDGFQALPAGRTAMSAMYAIAYAAPMTAHSDADGRPGRRAVQATQASAAMPVAIGTGSR